MELLNRPFEELVGDAGGITFGGGLESNGNVVYILYNNDSVQGLFEDWESTKVAIESLIMSIEFEYPSTWKLEQQYDYIILKNGSETLSVEKWHVERRVMKRV
jgi:hypothetical protein